MSDATGLAEALLGLDGCRVLAVSEAAAEVVIRIETTGGLVGCPGCGVRAVAHARTQVELRDLAAFGRPARLVWCKRLADLGVIKTHSRPYTSTDNPYSEAQFKTLKYRPGFPERFDSIEHARAFYREFFPWYNEQHRHSGIGLMTPAAVHHGQAEALHAERARVLDAAYAATPERFVRRPPRPPALPTGAWINKPDAQEAAH